MLYIGAAGGGIRPVPGGKKGECICAGVAHGTWPACANVWYDPGAELYPGWGAYACIGGGAGGLAGGGGG